MTASPLVAGIEAIAAGHRAAGLSKREQLRAMVRMYIQTDTAWLLMISDLEAQVAAEPTPSEWHGPMRRARRVANGWNGGRAREFMETSPV